ncbi:DNA-dependent protein kinase catalytic subunit-like isoform X2 [Bacillus rossius redtenbacheri]|uniref:DNA-dependent protein kinase catalytic subunit-like isoform X2 n=1 Tax=Bacillus rossius redtenbacheri TaxID=93214 RepID=UPI002FDC9F78
MAEAIADILSSLASCSHDEARDKISVLRETFSVPLNAAQLDYAFATLFAEGTGIVSYVRRKLSSNDLGVSVAEALKLLAFLILQKFKKWLEDYIVDIKNVCMSCVVRNQTSADQKVKALEVLQAIFENGPWQRDLGVQDVICKVLNKITRREFTSKVVLGRAFHVLGVTARHHPDHMLPRSSEVLRHFFSALDYETSETTNVSFPVIEGCMNGLTEFLYSFTQSRDDSPENCERIYGYLERLSSVDPDEERRRTALRAALNLLARHGSQFSEHVYASYRHWHRYLNQWLRRGRDDSKVAVSALASFYDLVMTSLRTSEAHDRREVLQYFLRFFKEKLNGSAGRQEQHVVIQAFGRFAGPCRALGSHCDVSDMFLLTVQKAEELCLGGDERARGELRYLADYVASLASIVAELETVSPDRLAAFQRVLVRLVEAFPALPAPFRPRAVRAAAAALCGVASRGSSALEGLFSTVVYHGVVRTCSHRVAIDVELQKERAAGDGDRVSYKDYIPLWTGLLQLGQYSADEVLFSRHEVIKKIYDKFVSTIILLSDKLNLETKKKTSNFDKDDDVPVLDPEAGLEAVVPRDFQVFINLCDLSRDVLTSTEAAPLFARWVGPFCRAAVRHIHRHPLVSGFYKLLTVALQLCDRLHFFQDYAGAADDGRKTCYLLLTKCLSELTCRCQQYKGDLQVSCVQAVLAAPVQLVAGFVQQAQSVFQVSFRLGHSHIALAHQALSTLERWHGSLPASDVKPLLQSVLPELDACLRSLGAEDRPGTDAAEARGTAKRGSVRSFARRTHLLERPETELLRLQRRALAFVGQLDGEVGAALAGGREAELVSWDTEHHLEYALPFRDAKVGVNLDELLPRVVDLALNCSNRQTRVAACEFLHAALMYMLGRNVRLELAQPGHGRQLFARLLPALLQLGCDPDQVVLQLFSPLVPQLARWYSSEHQIRSRHTEALLLALMDGVTHPTDTAVRDYSARSLQEFVVWSIKHTAVTEESNVNIKAVLRMMCSFCTHPSSVKRLGGALVFNSTYRVLREESSVLDRHWLELLYHLVCSLALPGATDSTDASATDAAQQACLALDRVARVICEKPQLFLQASENRRVPPEMGAGRLEDAVEWLLRQCGALQPDCRRKSTELVSRLAPLLPEYGSAASFVQRHTVAELHAVCGGDRLPASLPRGVSATQTNTWLDGLRAGLDYYLWLVAERLVTPEHVFGPGTSARLFQAAECFVEQVSGETLGDVVSSAGGDAGLVSAAVEACFDEKKCSVVVGALDLAEAVLRCSAAVPATALGFLSSRAFCGLVASCALHPVLLGFDARHLRQLEALPGLVERLLQAACRHEAVRSGVVAALTARYAALRGSLLVDVEAGLRSGLVTELLTQVLRGLRTLHSCRLLPLLGSNLSGEELLNAVVASLVKTTDGVTYMVRLPPTTQMFGESVLKLSFLLSDQVDTLVQCVLDETRAGAEGGGAACCLGDHFLGTFRAAVLDRLLGRAGSSAALLLAGAVGDRALGVLAQMLQRLPRVGRDLRHRASAALKGVVVARWDAVQAWADAGGAEGAAQLLGMLGDLAAGLETAVGALACHSAVASWVAAQVGSRRLQLLQKERALFLLLCLTGPDDDDNPLLRTALKDFKDMHVPRQTSELPAGSLRRSGFVSAFSRLLEALEGSGSRVLLLGVLSMTAGDQAHVCEEALQTTLRYFVTRLPPEKQSSALEVPYRVFASRDYDPASRLGAALRFCRTMLQHACEEGLRGFATAHARQLREWVSQPCLSAARPEADHQLADRVGAWTVFELLFCRLDQSELGSPECPVTRAAFPGAELSGKELLVELCRRASSVRQETVPASLTDQAELTELFRKYQCATYNALISIISNSKRTPGDLKFYHTFLFSETRGRDKLLWSKIVDYSHDTAFSMDWEEIPARRKKLVAIRRSNAGAAPGGGEGGVAYPATGTQMLFDSTLREDVTGFDFTLSVLESRQALPAPGGADALEVLLEMDRINEHECMPSLCGLVRHLVEHGISPPPEGDPPSPPCWMEAIKRSLEDDQNPRNAHLFILKLILNCESYFKPYAHFWFAPVMRVLLSGCAGSNINYMFTDVVAMLLEWKDVAIPNSNDIERHFASQILDFFMRNVDSSRRDVFKYNLDVVKTIVELWKPCLDLPYQLLLDKIRPQENSPTYVVAGLQLAAILLANGLEPWNAVARPSFLEQLISNLDSSRSEVYLACAEVVGMALKALGVGRDAEPTGDAAVLLNGTKQKMRHWGTSASMVNKFLLCLHAAGKHCGAVAGEFAALLYSRVLKLSGPHLAKCLEMIGWCPETTLELAAVDAERFLASHDPDVQEAALAAFGRAVRLMDAGRLQSMVSHAPRLASHPSPACRREMLSILAWVYSEYAGNTSPEGRQLFEESKMGLVRGLVDADDAIQETVCSFWADNARLPAATGPRLVALVTELYSPATEELLTGSLARLALQPADHGARMFDQPLGECRFEEYRPLVSWRAQHATLAPLFADTLASQLRGGDAGTLAPGVRATQASLAFQPTVDASGGADASVASLSTFSSASSSGTLFTLGSGSQTSELNTTRSHLQFGFARPETTRSFLRRRFLRNQSDVREGFARREVGRSLLRQELQRESGRRREATVALYRTYRRGELPDVEIPHSALIRPLQALAKLDSSVASQVVVALFAGLARGAGSEEDRRALLRGAESALGHVLRSTVQCCPPVVETLLKMALPHTAHVRLEPRLVVSACRASGLYSLGALVLEKMLLDASEELVSVTPAKRARTEQSQDDGLWLQLAELYSGLEEWDVVRGVFSDKLRCSRAMREALVAESGRDWHAAQAGYLEAVQQDCCYRDYCRQAYYKCLSHLSKWEELRAQVYECAEKDADNLWSDQWSQENALPWFLSSELQLHLQVLGASGEGASDWPAMRKVQDWLENDEKAQLLKCNYSEVLAMMWLLKGNYGLANHHAAHQVNMFLASWAHLNPLARRSRASMVRALGRAVDMHTYLEVASIKSTENYQQNIESLMDKWLRSVPSENDSLVVWDQRIAYRVGFTRQIEERLASLGADDAALLRRLASTESEMELRLVDAALGQGNFHLARCYLSRTKSAVSGLGSAELSARWTLGYSRLLRLRADQEGETPAQFLHVLKAWKELDSVLGTVTSSHGHLLVETYRHQSALCQEMMRLIGRDASVVGSDGDAKVAQLFRQLALPRDSGADAVMKKLGSFGLSCLEKAVGGLAERQQGEEMAEAYLNIAQYCRSDVVKTGVGGELDRHVVQSILRAMKLGSREARQLFACVLRVPGLGSVHRHTFVTESAAVPEWMFLGWAGQILACLDAADGVPGALEDVALRLARSYPQAVVFPFGISRDKYAFSDDEEGRRARALVLRLSKILQGNRLLETFVEALTCLAPPKLILEYHLKALQACLQESPFDPAKFREMLRVALKESFSSGDGRPRLHGKLFDLEKYRETLVRITGADGSRVNSRNVRDALERLKKLEIQVSGEKLKNSTNLSDFSPWLGEFQASKFTDEIEVPGQYTGDKRPLPHLHAKVISFGKTVRVQQSLRRPVRLTVNGSDAREHGFLVKFGEDLRQDQRVTQLLRLMGETLERDAPCRERGLCVGTYAVVPLSSRVGLIQWLDDTLTLDALFKRAVTQEEAHSVEQIRQSYNRWICGNSRTSFPARSADYVAAYSRYTREQTVDKFSALVAQLPLDILRRSLESLSISPEAFFALRHNLAASYAAACACQWLLGVGDRHPGNCLVSLRDARCVGIDYGHAFGTATQFLPVPELVPFRLTPRLVGLMRPFELSGVFYETMVCVLRAVRCNHDVLLATMEVFVQEPSLDWLDCAKKQGSHLSGASGDQRQADEEKWYPRQKVQLARRKLQGANPAAVTLEELRGRGGSSECFAAVAKGDPAHNVRARMAGDRLSPEDQVYCLLDQATDYHILGKTWAGWQPWL